jgi:hypothetical protein
MTRDLFARTVVLDERAREVLDYICDEWAGAQMAWLAIEWTLARDAAAGPLLNVTDRAELRALEYVGARSIRQPDLYVIYEVLPHEIVIKVIGYDEAQASHAGRA